MTHSNTIEQLLGTVIAAAEDAIRKAFEAGRQEGAASARAAMMAKLESVLGESDVVESDDKGETEAPAQDDATDRAERGTVTPAMHVAMASGRGMTAKQVYEKIQANGHTSIKESTVRAKLNKWRDAKKARKAGSLWYLVVPKQEQREEASTKLLNGGQDSPLTISQ